MKTMRANQVKGDFRHFVQRGQAGIISEHLTYRKVLFEVTFLL